MRHNCLRMPQNTDLDGLRQWVITADGYYINAIGLAVILYALPHYWKQPYNTLALTGASWVVEFMYGHLDSTWHVSTCFCGSGVRTTTSLWVRRLLICDTWGTSGNFPVYVHDGVMLVRDFNVQMKPYQSMYIYHVSFDILIIYIPTDISVKFWWLYHLHLFTQNMFTCQKLAK